MIKFLKQNDLLKLIYQAELGNNVGWVLDRLNQDGKITLRRTFTFTSNALISSAKQLEDEDSSECVFKLGEDDGEYYRIDKEILGLQHDLLLAKSMKFKPQVFVANRDISIFRKIDALVNEQIIVGGKNEGAIPLADFEHLLQTFPTSTELTHYARSRISRLLKDYFGTLSDAERQLNNYLEKKKTLATTTRVGILENFELQKFEYIHNELSVMLNTADSYKEKDWQNKILDLLLFIFPKYIAVLENVRIKDFYSKANKVSNRYIDLMVIDANGMVDIIEIKKPFVNAVLSRNKYRGNYTPRTELAGAVMQAEKYLFHLDKWGQAGEREVYEKHKNELPSGLKLQITNPKALILLGRDNDFTGEQRFDFEIIRRKYVNMIDIMTYDDLLRRLTNIIAMMKRQVLSAKEGRHA